MLGNIGVGIIRGGAQQGQHIVVLGVLVESPQPLNHQLRGDFAGGMTAHAICQRQDMGANHGGILVIFTHQTAVGGGVDLKMHHYAGVLTMLPTSLWFGPF